MFKINNASSLLYRVYKIGHYPTVAGDLPGSIPTDVGAIFWKAATDRLVQFAFKQVGQLSTIVTITLCDIVKIKIFQK